MKRGISLTEVLVSIAISLVILGVVLNTFLGAGRSAKEIKKVVDVKDYAKEGIAKLDWIFQRWGVGVPCDDPTGDNNCTAIRACGGEDNYPPPSSLCINVSRGDPCDTIQFYASLGGMGFVTRIYGVNKVAVLSCRLETRDNDNCYYIKRGGLWVRDEEDNLVIASISNLDPPRTLDCVDFDGRSNATMDREVETQDDRTLELESGDLLIRVPYRITLYCAPFRSDNNRLWLYMRIEDMAGCKREHPQPLVPVESFKVVNDPYTDGFVRLRITFRGADGNTLTIERIFGRLTR
ncbi:hypothetical protein JCM9492_12610 [Aquifex pyrophilus]